MIITDVALFRVSAFLSPQNGADDIARSRQSQPIDIYREMDGLVQPPRPAGPREMRAIYVEILTDEGPSGLFGPIQPPQAFVIDQLLRPVLIGRDPLATEALLDQMLRLNRHGRSGIFMTGVSPIDCALWDLKGKAWDKPIYRLLGGPTRAAVPAYASMLGYSVEPDLAAEVACQYVAKGYSAQKWFFRYGPAHGAEGLGKNLAMAQAVRDAVGPHYPLMFDAFMSWTVPYATQMVQALAALNPTWMEEPIPPERVSEFRKLRVASSVPIATGEHVYTRWQTKELLVQQAVDVLQNDPDWTGGITELCKICALASAFEVPLVPHGHSLLAALHVAGAQSPTTVPYVEFLVNGQPNKQFFHKPTYEPVDGSVPLPDLPGLGLVLDEDKIERREPVSFG
jgi:L-alanine-DL-glutamate epimerase-like enolase superfamily enzyme